jgi:hypothetical protein
MPSDATRRHRIRALREAAILTVFYLVSQLLVVPLVAGRPWAEQVAPALLCGVLLFVFAYFMRRARDRRHRDRR